MYRSSLVRTIVAISATFVATSAAAQSLPVFPGAQGHGSKTVAGSGRHLSKPATTVFKVWNLNDSGTGSLRACAEAKVPRVCVFEISGRIHLKSEFRIKYPYITIAGQTAPSPGVMITGSGLRVATHNVLIQHLEVRPGDGRDGIEPGRRDGITVAAGTSGTTPTCYNVVVDHVSASWAIDENASVWNPATRDVTFSHMIIAEGLQKSIHPEGEHSKGLLISERATRVSVHNSLLAHNWDRNPRLQGGASIEFVNNVVYNWGGPSGWNGANLSDSPSTGLPVMLNFIGNFYKRGKSSPSLPVLYAKPLQSKTRVYAHSNYGPTRTVTSGDEWAISGLPTSARASSSVVSASGLTTRAPASAYEYVLTNAGSRPRERNRVDARIISEVRNGTGDMKDCVGSCTRSAGGWPVLKVNTRKLTPPSDTSADSDRDGYTNLEEWLHAYADALE
jgi:hypothetical protein